MTGNRKFAGAGKRTRRTRSTAASDGSALDATTSGGRNGKYNAIGERVDGVWMASAAQAERYRQLLRMQMNGAIDNLRTEVPFDLIVNNTLICRYRADFCYDVTDGRGGVLRQYIEDVKGMVTPEFRLKEKLFNALQPVKLSVIHVTGKVKGSSTAWLDKHWAGRLPD